MGPGLSVTTAQMGWQVGVWRRGDRTGARAEGVARPRGPTVIAGAWTLSVPPIETFTVSVWFSGKSVEKALYPLLVQAFTAVLYGARVDP